MKKISLLTLLLLVISGFAVFAKKPAPVTFTAQQDHDNMMQQLGIKSVRPGPSGTETAPNHANYDEALANPCPQLPDALILNNGTKVTTADMWWKQRRPEIVEGFEKEVYGRLPKNIPAVTWTVKVTDNETVGRVPVIAKQVIGHVDNRKCPSINVDINMLYVVPTNVKGPVPVLIMFGRGSFPAPGQPAGNDLTLINEAIKALLAKSSPEMKTLMDKYPLYTPFVRQQTTQSGGGMGMGMGGMAPAGAAARPAPAAGGPGAAPSATAPATLSSTEQLLAAGWGYAYVDPGSIQADNGAGLTKGIIGLVNKGQPRKPDDWGSLRAWAWGAARALDFLETDPLVDSKKVGIEGVSRYGKAALVTLAFEQRFAMALVGSSGKGGATPHRRVFGEAVESLAGSGEYHWMAGNYIKYAAEEPASLRKTGCDLPVDNNQLIALCAPRLAFISYGIPEQGDAKWLDQTGSYMSTVDAGKVYKLLGAKDLGVSNDYMKEKMPPVLTGLLDGHLAWRQHAGGHTDGPNYEFFIPWATKMLGYTKETKQVQGQGMMFGGMPMR